MLPEFVVRSVPYTTVRLFFLVINRKKLPEAELRPLRPRRLGRYNSASISIGIPVPGGICR
jgi:hypothetical protein